MDSKNKQRVVVLCSIDRQLPLEEIAEQSGLSINEILESMLFLVGKGTVMDIDYLCKQATESHTKDRLQQIRQRMEELKRQQLRQKAAIIKAAADKKSLCEMTSLTGTDEPNVVRLMHRIVRDEWIDVWYLAEEATGKLKNELKSIDEEARTWRLRRKHPDSYE